MESNPLSYYLRNVVTPYLSLREGNSQEKLTKMWRRDGERSERWAVMAQIGVRMLHAKAGRLSPGAESRESWGSKPSEAKCMITGNTVDTNPHSFKTAWLHIDWTKVKRTVRRLQERIVKAFQQGEFRKVKDLQRLLRKSYHARLLAVHRVTTNKGWKTPGVDGVIWKTAKQKFTVVEQLLYPIPQAPLRRIYIPKKNGKKRPLGIPTMSIRGQQALHALTLEPITETTADPSSFGFRPVRSCADAMKRLFSLLCQGTAPQWVLEGDIKSCFDEISHTWIINNIPMDKKVLQGWLTAGYLEERTLFPTDKGTPQGGLCKALHKPPYAK